MYIYFLNISIFYVNWVRGVDLMMGEEISQDVFRHLSDFDVSWATKEKTDSSIMETIHMSGVPGSLKCYKKVTKQTNSLQMENLITNRSVSMLEACRRILNTQCVKT
jgi:hypothetical protein